MHYNPFAYIHSEKDILKLVTTLMPTPRVKGKAGDRFWDKAETLLLTALIGYLHYEAPVEEQNFATLLEMLNAMQVPEDDEEFQNPVDLLFEELEKRSPTHFAVRQYKITSWPLVIYALSDFLIMILSWLVKQSLRAFLFQEVQL